MVALLVALLVERHEAGTCDCGAALGTVQFGLGSCSVVGLVHHWAQAVCIRSH